jgi:hypothetical protein
MVVESSESSPCRPNALLLLLLLLLPTASTVIDGDIKRRGRDNAIESVEETSSSIDSKESSSRKLVGVETKASPSFKIDRVSELPPLFLEWILLSSVMEGEWCKLTNLFPLRKVCSASFSCSISN